VLPRMSPFSTASTILSPPMRYVLASSLPHKHPLMSEKQDDGFGPFSDTAATGEDPFTFSPSLADDLEVSGSFDDFGAFGDFQTAEQSERQLTPTAESWSSFTSTNSSTHSETSLGDPLEEFGGTTSTQSSTPGDAS
jgi:serine/threonine-protein phosphatase 6 regulatory subunit 3